MLSIVAMVAAGLGYLVPVRYFDPTEAIPNRRAGRDPDLPNRSWWGPTLALLSGLVTMVGYEVVVRETLTPMPRGASLAAFLGAGLIGTGVGNAIGGYCSYGTGGSYIPGGVYTFFDPGRARRVGVSRAVLGMASLALVAVVTLR